MKVLPGLIILFALFPLAARAQGNRTLELGFPEGSFYIRESAKRLEKRVSYLDVKRCFVREAQEAADALGLPRRICISRIGVEIPGRYRLPFGEGSAMLIEGGAAQGRKHISGGARHDDGWNIVGSLISVRKKPKCGRLSSAHASVYASIDHEGALLDRAPEVKGFVMDGSALCRDHAKAVHFDYALEAGDDDGFCSGFGPFMGCVRAGDCVNSCPTRKGCWIDDSPRCATEPAPNRTACWCAD